jgi:hypothetical protein
MSGRTYSPAHLEGLVEDLWTIPIRALRAGVSHSIISVKHFFRGIEK